MIPLHMFRTASRAVAGLAVMSAVALAGLSTPAGATGLTVVSPSQKLCQLTGDTDWTSGAPTAARTNWNFHLVGVDLGFPVDSGSGPLYFLFGDARPSTGPNTLPPDDALGVTTRTAAPDSATCLDLALVTQAPADFAHPTVSPSIMQGAFNVPTGGVFVDKAFYAFFWTDHCLAAQPLLPMPDTPLKRPTPQPGGCPEVPAFSSIGHSVLARATIAAPAAFTQTSHVGLSLPNVPPIISRRPTSTAMPSGFVYVSAAPPGPQLRLPPELGIEKPEDVVPVFGVARYRASIPYLALAPRETFGDPATWLFYAGGTNGTNGQPTFISRDAWESGHDASGEWTPPKGAELYADSLNGGIDERCVGEHSVTWNAALRSWLLLYGCLGQVEARVEARTAPQPWGPWSTPTTLLSTSDSGVACALIMLRAYGCGPMKQNDWPLPNVPTVGGFFYAPFVMERFTQNVTPPDAGEIRQAKIYWLVSTWNPYQVIVMQATLQLAPN